MRCFCCDAEINLARKVKIRQWIHFTPEKTRIQDGDEFDFTPYLAYREQVTYRWAVICQVCYRLLDNHIGTAEIGDKEYNMSMASRLDRANTINEEKYQAWQRREARKLGLELE